jgi:Fe-S-cluster containining protein
MPKECGMCGKCCRAITLGKEMDLPFVTQEASKGNEDAKFILKNWTSISLLQAYELRPDEEFKALVKRMGETTWWTCKNLDSETNKCKVHTERPKVCSGFPYYGRGTLPNGFIPYSNSCTYLEGVALFEDGQKDNS